MGKQRELDATHHTSRSCQSPDAELNRPGKRKQKSLPALRLEGNNFMLLTFSHTTRVAHRAWEA
jgi:hypothetical protein